MNYLYGLLAIIVLIFAVEQYGEHRIQSKWDIETARLQGIAKEAERRNKENISAIEAQHKKDIEHAKSKAGKSAVSDWLKSHGLLPDGSAVSGSGSCEAQSTTKPNGKPEESGTGNGIKAFATDCALDALHVLMFQEWVKREGMD